MLLTSDDRPRSGNMVLIVQEQKEVISEDLWVLWLKPGPWGAAISADTRQTCSLFSLLSSPRHHDYGTYVELAQQKRHVNDDLCTVWGV